MKYKKSIITLSLCSAFAVANTDTNFMAIIGVENTIAQKKGTIEKNVTLWVNEGSEHSCSDWTPYVSTIDYGVVFEQLQNCSQNQKRTKDIYTVYDTGAEVFERRQEENKIIIITKNQDNSGTKNFKDTERADSWSSWADKGSHYDCETWSPSPSEVDYGDSFTQTRDCSQDQERTREVYDVWADNSETYNRTESGSQTITENESRTETGTKNYIDKTRDGNWSIWLNVNGHYDCETWSPSPSEVDYGDSFTQTRDCSQNQTRSRDVYDVWADGKETLNSLDIENKTITEIESQSAIGTKNFKDTERADSWSSWADKGSHYDCETWSPSPSEVDYGDSFTQTRDCSQDQERTREVYDVWADNSETYNRTESGSQTITENESKTETGTKNYIDKTRDGNWSGWGDSGSQYNCSSWSPATSTINLDQSFTQTQSCKQNQTRTRTIYNIWANGTETVKNTESSNQTVTETNSRGATGTKNFISTTRTGNWSGWGDSGSQYNCSSWSPATSTINLDQSFTQTQSCKQNQTRSRTIYNVWANGTETVKNTESGNQTVTETNSRGATGTKNFISTTRTGNWSGWSDSGIQYNCSSWNPATSTINLGSAFTQTQSCKQNQTRARTIYNVWANGTETVKNTESGNQTVTETNSRGATGTKNYITGSSYGSWSGWTDKNGHYSCASWSPATSTVNLGSTFTQTRSCKQDQTSIRTVYDDWANGAKTTKTTETKTQTINENESKSATGTKNYITGTSSGSWSNWNNSGSQYSCASWSPATSTINLDQSFTQTQSCKQNQTRTRTIYNVWANGTQTVKSTETDSQSINVQNSRTAKGTKPVVECRFGFIGGNLEYGVRQEVYGPTSFFTFMWNQKEIARNPYPNATDSTYSYYKGDLKNSAGTMSEFEICRRPK